MQNKNLFLNRKQRRKMKFHHEKTADEIVHDNGVKGNKNRAKNKEARYTRKKDYSKSRKFKNHQRNKKRRERLHLNFNHSLDEQERKRRNDIRDTRRKARDLKPLKNPAGQSNEEHKKEKKDEKNKSM